MPRIGILLVAGILLAVAAPRCPVAYGDSSDEHATPQSEPPPRKALLKWPGLTQGDDEEPNEPRRLDPDRPHLPESSTAVGKGRIVLESGYTFTKKGSAFTSQTYPEALLRIGMFADWFEFRLGQSFLNREQTVAGVRTRAEGAQDLYLGIKLALVEQQGLLPEIAVIPQMTLPTGSKTVGAGKVLPGLNVDCAWEVINERFSI